MRAKIELVITKIKWCVARILVIYSFRFIKIRLSELDDDKRIRIELIEHKKKINKIEEFNCSFLNCGIESKDCIQISRLELVD